MLLQLLASSFAALLVAARAISDTHPPRVDVVVIGAGYAGLSAARDLTRANRSVLVFEANRYPGGRVLDFNLSDVRSGAGIIELGGEWLDGDRNDQPNAWQLIVDELGFTAKSPHYGKGTGIFYTASQPDGLEFDVAKPLEDSLGQLPKHVRLELYQFMEKLGHMYAALPKNSTDLDSVTLDVWMQKHLKHAESRAVVRMLTLLLNSEEPIAHSMLSLVKSWQGMLVDLLTNARSYRIVGGAQAPLYKMAAELGDRVRLSSPVVALSQDLSGVLVTVKSGLQVRAKRVIFTGSPWTSTNVVFDPPLPASKLRLFQRLPPGNLVKMMVVYDTPFWRDSKHSGLVLSSIEAGGILFPSCMDNSPIEDGQSIGVLVCFCAGDCSTKLMGENKAARQTKLTSYLARAFGDRALTPFFYTDYDWSASPFVGGGPSVVLGPRVLTQHFSALANEFGRVVWAGSDTRPPTSPNRGNIDGAVQSGREAAGHVLRMLETRDHGVMFPMPSRIALAMDAAEEPTSGPSWTGWVASLASWKIVPAKPTMMLRVGSSLVIACAVCAGLFIAFRLGAQYERCSKSERSRQSFESVRSSTFSSFLSDSEQEVLCCTPKKSNLISIEHR